MAQSDWSQLFSELSLSLSAEEEKAWDQALKHVRRSHTEKSLSDESIFHLAKASPSIEVFLKFAQLIFISGRSHPHKRPGMEILLDYVDNSDYSLEDWILAHEIIDSWLEERGLKAEFLTKLGYLQCCALSQESSDILRTLQSISQEMLENHGFELADKKSDEGPV